MRKLCREVFDRLSVWIGCANRLAALSQSSQDRIRKAGYSFAVSTREVDALRDNSIAWHAIEVEDLVGPGPQDFTDRTLKARDRFLEVCVQVMVDSSTPGERAEHDLPE